MTKEEARHVLKLQYGHTDRELETARKMRLKEVHPDCGGDGSIDLINAAHTTLVNPDLIDWGGFEIKKERDLQKEFVESLIKEGAFVFNCHGGAMQKVGMPDLYIAHRLFHGWVELKVGENVVSLIQQVRINELLKSDVVAVVLREGDFEYNGVPIYAVEGVPTISDLVDVGVALKEFYTNLRW